MRPGDAPRRPLPPSALGLIRAALVAGVLLFGAVVWWLHRDGRPAPANPDAARALGVLALAFALGAVAAALAIRAVVARPPHDDRLRVVAWAVGESAALVGGVHWLLSGDPSRYIAGLTAMCAAIVLVPVKRDR